MIVNPLVGWIWIGALIALAGAVVARLALGRGPAAGRGRLRGPAGQASSRRRQAVTRMELLLALVIVVLVAAFVSVPLRRGTPEEGESGDGERAGRSRGRKQAKYREIRDAEADHAAGKLRDDDYRRLDEELRREAIGILEADGPAAS